MFLQKNFFILVGIWLFFSRMDLKIVIFFENVLNGVPLVCANTILRMQVVLNGILSDVSYVKLKCIVFVYHRRNPISMARVVPA